MVLAAAAGRPDAELLECLVTPISQGTGAATAAVVRLTGRLRAGADELRFAMIRKQFRSVRGGRHAAGASDPRHWAYWRREPLAYAAGLLPSGPGLAAPCCYGVVDEVVYLAEVAGPAESLTVAARRLGAWQATTVPEVPWLAGHQLAQRVAVSWLDWSAVQAPDTRWAAGDLGPSPGAAWGAGAGAGGGVPRRLSCGQPDRRRPGDHGAGLGDVGD